MTEPMDSCKSILIVDDDPDDIELFTDAVKYIDRTFRCFSASTGIKALQGLRKSSHTKPDFIFVDMNMPGMNGLELLSELRKMKKLSETPIVIYSTTSRKEDREKSLKLGAVGFFTKPIHFRDICDQIQELLQSNIRAR